jgi:cytochrome d ubiquinol oxidase subunit I
VIAAIAAPVQVMVGDVAARGVLEDQPAKFASMELIVTTGPHQPEIIGGVLVDGQVVGGLAIPSLASLIAGFSPDTVITGLDTIPVDERPPATIVHLAWDAMVGTGTALVVLALWGLVNRLRRRDYATARWFLRASALAGFGAILALEAGWIVTEVGRQPWVVYGYLRTADAVTHASGVRITFIGVVVLYSALGVATLVALFALKRRWAAQDASADGGRALGGLGPDDHIPYGPTERSDEGLS